MAYAAAGLRATSFVASAGVLGLAVLAALTMSIQMMPADPFDQRVPVVDVVSEPPPPPVEPEQQVRTERNIIVDEQPFTQRTVFDAEAPPTEDYRPPSFGPPEPVTILTPRWLQRPSNLARYYPRRAIAMEMEGEVVLDCLVSTAGALNCTVASETPPSWGFGEAALRMAREHRMEPAQRDGVAVEGRHRMRVPFNLD